MTDGTGAQQTDRAASNVARIDTSRPNSARVYDVFLGGRDNYPVDRAAARAALEANPRGYLNVWHNRDFVRRAVSHLVGDMGIRQFLDIGTGLPTAENVHQIAQRIAPESRVVYTDNDPVVLTHARALLTSGPDGVTDYLDADLRDPDAILRLAAPTLDFGKPIALVLAAILHFVEDEAAYGAVARLARALPSGSYLIVSHLTTDLNPESGSRAAKAYTDSGLTFVLRSKDAVQRFFTDNGLELIDPGIVPVHHWRPDHRPWPLGAGGAEDADEDMDVLDHMDDIEKIRFRDINDVTDADINVYGGVAHKP
ncbi:MAG: SAM-dependent methyltransferase [Catenulispora sp.]|nr:SAM-dependent methyltransferase [Catenulispora sp.]